MHDNMIQIDINQFPFFNCQNQITLKFAKLQKEHNPHLFNKTTSYDNLSI